MTAEGIISLWRCELYRCCSNCFLCTITDLRWFFSESFVHGDLYSLYCRISVPTSDFLVFPTFPIVKYFVCVCLDVLMGKKWIHNCYDMMKLSWFYDSLWYLWSFINVFMCKDIKISSIFPRQVLSQKGFHHWHPLLTLDHSLKKW